jgi:signal transduction histidine kinase
MKVNPSSSRKRPGIRGGKASPAARESRCDVEKNLVRGFVHQLRNVIFSISAHLESLEDVKTVDAACREAIATIRAELTRIGRLMQELQEYGTPPPASLTHGPIAPVIRNALAASADRAHRAGIRLVERIAPDLTDVKRDAARLCRAIECLLTFAIVRTPREGVVTLSARRTRELRKRWITIEVADAGPRLESHARGRLFEPFFGRSPSETGLGLAIARVITQQHKGGIGVVAARKGARLWLRIPAPEIRSSRVRR